MRLRGPLQDPNVRKAIAAAYDYGGFIASAFRGRAAPAQGPLYTKHPFHDASLPRSKQDLASAKELLAKSAYPNGGFELSIMILPAFFSFHNAEAQILQDGLKSLGITLNILPMPEIAQYYGSMEDEEKGADMWAWHASTQTPDYNFQGRRIYGSQYKRPAGVNGGYSNERVDALLAEDQRTADPARRKQLWAELQKTLVEDQPALFLAVPFQFLTRREELQGVPLNVFNFVPNYYNAWLKRNK
jgi:peptide/nickel transport system substrate-binding protein